MIVEDRSVKNSGPSSSYTSIPRYHRWSRVLSASIAARASINAPRAVLINIDPHFIWERVCLLIRCLVSGVRGQCNDTMSDSASRDGAVTGYKSSASAGHAALSEAFLMKCTCGLSAMIYFAWRIRRCKSPAASAAWSLKA